MKQIVQWAIWPAVAIAMVLLVPTSARAQNNMNLSAGYQFAHFAQSGFGETFPYGWYVDLSGTVRPMLAWVVEGGGVYKSVSSVTIHEYSYQGGVRYFSTANPTATPFGQVLIGGVTAGGGGGNSVSAFSVQVGGGVTVKATDRLGVRIGVDYRRDFFSDTDGGGENVLRVALGVVIPIGQ